ncbi:MAG: nucleotidyltransferase family protein [Erysipelotrichaceae bacterium]|nr:nucleotidyltransferase family protein [Erysipelotrichaceae bacterium]
MKSCGIVTEYNPFHNGHIYHIQKSREMTDCEVLIAVMSGNFTQRGEPAVCDKYQRAEAALRNGVDIVIELPFICAVQNGSVFGAQSVSLLKKAGVSDIVFGSETGNLEELQEIASLPVNVDHLKERMHQGESYPKAYGLLADYIYPNDRLAVCYLRALEGSEITPHALPRSNDYNDTALSSLASASAVRKALLEGRDISEATPMEIPDPVFMKDLYPYLRRLLLLRKRETVQQYFLVNEGIEKLMHDAADRYDDYEAFLKACVSKRYTRSRIQRTALQILCENSKEEVKALEDPTYLRVLGFTPKGQEYLKEFKKKEKIITLFKEIPPSYKVLEERAMQLYASLYPEEKRKALLKRELMGPIRI